MGWLGDTLKAVFPVSYIANAGVSALGKAAGIGGGGNSGTNETGTSPYMGQQFSNLGNFGANPYSSSLANSIQGMKGFSPVTPQKLEYTGGSYTAKDMSKADLPQYDAMRSRLNSQYGQQQSQAQDSLDRQFAAAGGGPGNGAQAKQTENLATGFARQKGQDLEGINTQEAAMRTGLQQQEAQKEFSSGEAARGYGFQANELNAGNDLQAQQFNQQMQQGENQFRFGANAQIAGLNTSWDQASAEANNNEFNKALSEWQARHMGGILGGGGFLGTGFGA